MLTSRGYSSADVDNIMHGNYLRLLAKALPNG
jgi:microsomal dipeptidase-like Zn-dependent dipeptidase